ncbi:speckle targeted PIP5K1A-regulated poly(A) polymerase isoform 2-T2 [Discoglossus pictus]
MEVFEEIAPVKNIVMDKDRGLYAIVEFESKDGVCMTLAETLIKLGGRQLKVKPRQKKEFQRKKGGTSRNLQQLDPEVLCKKLILCSDVNDQMDSVVSLCSPSHDESRLRQLLLSLLQETFTEFFPGCQLLPFGSSVNGFEISGCDLDLYLDLGEQEELEDTQRKGDEVGGEGARKEGERDVDMGEGEKREQEEEDLKEQPLSPGNKAEKIETCEEMVEEGEKRENEEEAINSEDESESDEEEDITPGLSLHGASHEEVLELVGKVLRHCVPGVHGVQSVSSARRPVIRFQHKTSGLRGDITLNNRLALRNSSFLRLCSDLDPRVSQLVYTVRYWARVNQLAGNPLGGGPLLNNYALTLLIIFFLQTRSPPVIPTLSQMRKEAGNEASQMIDGWDCSFPSEHTQLQASENQQSLSSLLSEFFLFYSSLDLSTILLSTCDGSILPLPLSSPVPSWSEGFRLGPINVQDPFELSHNVCGNVSNRTSRRFYAQCSAAARTCRSPIFQLHSKSRHWGIILILLPAVSEGGKGDAEVLIPLRGASLEDTCAAVKRVLVEVLLCTYEESNDSMGGEGSVEVETVDRRVNEENKMIESKDKEKQGVPSDEEQLNGNGMPVDTQMETEENCNVYRKKRDREEIDEIVEKKRKVGDHLSTDIPVQENCKSVKPGTEKETSEQPSTKWRMCVWHRVWEGRRKQRRSLRGSKEQGEKLEIAVSRALASEKGEKVTEPLLRMEINAQLAGDGRAKLSLTPKSDPHGLCPQFFHFLDGFLPRLVGDKLGGASSEENIQKGE